MILTGPAACPGVSATYSVEFTFEKLPGVVPNRICFMSVKWLPEILTLVPPASDPKDGVKLSIFG